MTVRLPFLLRLPAIEALSIAFLLWAALATHPYGYYMFLRVWTCAACVHLAIKSRRLGIKYLVGICCGVAVLYNPLIRVHLTRELWIVVNLATVAFFIFAAGTLTLRAAARARMDPSAVVEKPGSEKS